MATANERRVDESTSNQDARTRVAGAWLAVGALLLVVGFVLHPPPAPDAAAFMATVADGPTRWVAAHAATAVALAAFAIAGLVALTAGSRLTRTRATTTAWAVVVVAALWVTTAAVVEATVVTRAAVAGDAATFETWSLFAEAHSAAFLAFVLAVAVIAAHEAASESGTGSAARSPPSWASWLGALAGVGAFVGMVLVFVLGVAPGGVVWLTSTVVLGLWTLWFGVALVREGGAAWATSREPDSGGRGAV